MKAHISPKILISVASLYNDTNRIFMEYIDNSIDSAEVFFDEESNSYSKDISIEFYLDKKTKFNEAWVAKRPSWIVKKWRRFTKWYLSGFHK